MFNSEALEVGIGMAFLFLLMALICTAIKEWIEGIFKWRAMDLERALRNLLDDKDGMLAAHLFAHPMISSLFQGQYDASALRSSWMTPGAAAKHVRLRSRRNLPSYIPAAHFATAFLDLVARGPVDDGAGGAGAAPPVLSIAALRERAAALSSPFLRRAVLTTIDHARGDLQQVTLNTQRWFDGAMDRASGWYKRRTQSILFCLGLVAAVVLNVDAVHVMGRLTADKTFRQVVVNAAAHAQNPASAAAGTPTDHVKQARQQIQEVGMPVGWRPASSPYAVFGQLPLQMCAEVEGSACTATGASGYAYLRAALGWLVTAFAVMLGAPFWFDMLNKFMVIRSTVKPHEKSPEEGSEDRPEKKAKAKGEASEPAPAPPDGAPPGAAGGTAGALLSAAAAPRAPPPDPALAFVANQWRPGAANLNEVAL